MFTLGRGVRTTVTAPVPVPVLILVLVTVEGGAGLGCWLGFADDRATALAPHATLAALLTGAAAVTLQVALGWLFVVTLLLALERRAGRELTGLVGCPRGVRRALVTGCGLVLSGAVVITPAHAHGDRPAPTSTIDGLPLPERISGRTPAAPPITGHHRPGPGRSGSWCAPGTPSGRSRPEDCRRTRGRRPSTAPGGRCTTRTGP